MNKWQREPIHKMKPDSSEYLYLFMAFSHWDSCSALAWIEVGFFLFVKDQTVQL